MYPRIFKSLFGLVLFACGAAHAVTLSNDGYGQALVFPYYTVRPTADGGFNTYLSISNTNGRPKAIKLRLREGRSGAQVGEMNIYLAAADMWTGALVPDDVGGVRLVSADKSCTNPVVPATGLVFPAVAIDDGQGTGPDRLTEGYVEVLEMGQLQGSALTSSSVPNCQRLLDVPLVAADIAAPRGGLAGSATLINVRSARAFSYAATALDGVATSPYFSQPVNGIAFPGPGNSTFESPAVDPVSLVTIDGTTYRSTWSRGIDAVTAVFMTMFLDGEFVMDAPTASKTDWVFTAPTRNAYVRPGMAPSRPFKASLPTQPCDGVLNEGATRDTWGMPFSIQIGPGLVPAPFLCWSTAVYSEGRDAAEAMTTTDVLGSANTKYRIVGHWENGWMRFKLFEAQSMTPLSTSTFSSSTGTTGQANISFRGLPIIGFSLSTYDNGALDCAGATCKGNFGTLVPLRPVPVVN